MVKRITINLPDTVGGQLKKWADIRDQPIATVAAIAIELQIKALEASGELPTPSAEGAGNDPT